MCGDFLIFVTKMAEVFRPNLHHLHSNVKRFNVFFRGVFNSLRTIRGYWFFTGVLTGSNYRPIHKPGKRFGISDCSHYER